MSTYRFIDTNVAISGFQWPQDANEILSFCYENHGKYSIDPDTQKLTLTFQINRSEVNILELPTTHHLILTGSLMSDMKVISHEEWAEKFRVGY